jgi:hypothetical protein
MENAEVGISINARYRVILNLSEPRLKLPVPNPVNPVNPLNQNAQIDDAQAHT